MTADIDINDEQLWGLLDRLRLAAALDPDCGRELIALGFAIQVEGRLRLSANGLERLNELHDEGLKHGRRLPSD